MSQTLLDDDARALRIHLGDQGARFLETTISASWWRLIHPNWGVAPRRAAGVGSPANCDEAYDVKAALDAGRRPGEKKTRKMAKIGGFFEWL